MRAMLYLVVAFVGLYFVYSGLTPAPMLNASSPSPSAHNHQSASATTNTAASTAATATQTAAKVQFNHELPGYAVYKARGCNVCHGSDLNGSRMGPSLAPAREHWNQDSLAAYLADPESFIESDARLAQLDSQFARFAMPAFDDMTDLELQQLAELILAAE